jgi:ATP-dependent DNA ligase
VKSASRRSAAIRTRTEPAFIEPMQCKPVTALHLPEKRASRWGESLTEEKMSQCRWVKPKLVSQVAFVEWTDAGHLRHCTFVAMRDDKKAC